MTKDDIIRMAREAEFCDAKQMELNIEWTCVFPELQHFANLVAAAEREACAVIAFNAKTYLEAAESIRARGQG
jgi:hypothetical protein